MLFEKYRQFLTDRGMRLTWERETTAREILTTVGQIETDYVVSILDNPVDGKRVSRATVYRTLDHLVRAGCVTSVQDEGGTQTYHIAGT